MVIRKSMLAAALTACAAACRGSSAPPPPAASTPPSSEWFVERAAAAGLDFTHFNGMSGGIFYAEHMGPGVAVFDYDNDGDLDVFITQGQMLGKGRTLDQATFPPKGPLPLKGRLFRNDLEVNAGGARSLRFTDVTDASLINQNGYGMGAATADYNNDGCVDLYVTTFGRNQLFRNNCNGTFTDVSRASGVDDGGWSSSAAFFDYDRDGHLDLFVAHYLNYSPERNILCYSVTGKPDYCPPHVYQPQPSRLFHNNGNGTFTDVSVPSGVAREFGPALGVVSADFNGDGWIDFYVANDGQPNNLWVNQHDGTFKSSGLLSGTALSAEGDAKSSMGVDAGDIDNDGDEDLMVTELTGQGTDLYVNDGDGAFVDESARSKLRFLSLPYTGFGAAWLDFDNDGLLDMLTVNGAVTAIDQLMRADDPFPLRQRRQLLRNVGNRQFEDVTGKAGAVFQKEAVGRGAAFGDIDNDGDTDVVVANDNGPAELFVNEIGHGKHWIGLRTVGGDKPRDLVGARVEIVKADGSSVWRRARADGSYASANDPRVLAGLGDASGPVRVRVDWPDGTSKVWEQLPIDRYTTLTEGTAK